MSKQLGTCENEKPDGAECGKPLFMVDTFYGNPRLRESHECLDCNEARAGTDQDPSIEVQS